MEETASPALPAPPQILQALVAVSAELAKIGVSKARTNEQQHFRFRGIDDVVNAICPLLPKHGVVLLPEYQDFPDVDRPSTKGGTLIYSKVIGTFRFRSALDGSEVSVVTVGKAMDSADKGSNKAMSAALKYALLQTFMIPTESTEDADATTPEPSYPPPPPGFNEWLLDIVAVADEGYPEFQRAWKATTKEIRDYGADYHKTKLAEAKAHALDVTKKAEAKAAPQGMGPA